MVWLALLLAGAVGATPPAPAPTAPQLYRVELEGGQSAWSIGEPQLKGALLLFRHYPDGALMSVRSRDVKKIVATGAGPQEDKRLRPGEAIEIEATGGGSAAGGAAVAGKPAVPPPGSRKDGTALFNPDRRSNPDGGFVNNTGGVSFETSWYDWGPYAAKMLRRIKLHWKLSKDLMVLAQKGIVRIGFSIMADGRVADVEQIRSSTTLPYDQAALKAIVESNPFDPLPKDLLERAPGKDHERVVIDFVYYIDPSELDKYRTRQ